MATKINKIAKNMSLFEKAKELIFHFDALLITVGPGMSTSSGYTEIRSNKVNSYTIIINQ